ncbi:MAG: dihydroorotase [Cyanobacteria bacterium P01_F01_bin.150]
MTRKILIKNAQLVNEGRVFSSDVRICNERIEKISESITASGNEEVVDASGFYLIPGMIDDQVHFREPGLTHKGTIASESRAAVAGGITSFMEMPNVNPSTTTIEALEDKYEIARKHSIANYAFYLGATEHNIEQIKRLDPSKYCGVKIFMGASTGNLLVENQTALEAIFREAPTLIATHCESSPLIAKKLARVKDLNRPIVITDHPVIRDAEVCFASSSLAVDLAKRYGSQLHVLHITTAKELSLFDPGPISNKSITAEACVHHLWFSDQDYAELGNLIKCNPAIKTTGDRAALIQALHDDRIDIIATDHAPHTWEEKQVDYPKAPAGLPLVQHALLTLFEQVTHKLISLTQLVEKTAHNPAIRYGVVDRGYLREGYFADLVLVDRATPFTVTPENILYYCGWSPFMKYKFSSSIVSTWVNGQLVFDGQKLIECPGVSKRLEFKGVR